MAPPTHASASADIELLAIPTSPAPTDKELLEHCAISEKLRQDLDIDSTANAVGNFGQIRAFRDNRAQSALFTVIEIDTAETTVAKLRIYPNEASREGGVYKLYETTSTSVTLDACEVENIAPSTTEINDGGSTTTDNPFTDVDPPPGSKFFTETAEVPGNNEVVLLVPHGGGIEPGTSGMVGPFKTALEDCNRQNPSVWLCEGQWGSGQTSKRWHITSKEVDPRSFPGLFQIDQQPEYLPGVKARYAVSFHGFGYQDGTGTDLHGVIIGGRAHLGDKNTIRHRIADKLGAASVSYAVVETDGTVHHSGTAWDGKTDDDLRRLSGRSEANIVNRLSPNDGGVPYRGGIQIEISKATRTAHGSDLAEAVAEALCEMVIGEPGIYLRDFPGDVGDPHDHGSISASPDVGAYLAQQDMGAAPLNDKSQRLVPEELVVGMPAWAYVRAYNKGDLPSPAISAHLYDSQPSTLVDPTTWNVVGTADLGSLPAAPAGNDNPTLGEIEWTPSFAGHRCFVCLLSDHAIHADELANLAQGWNFRQYMAFIRSNAWAAWRNYDAVQPSAVGDASMEAQVRGYHDGGHRFEIAVGITPDPDTVVRITIPTALFELLSNRSSQVQVVDQQGDFVTLLVAGAGEFSLGTGVLPASFAADCRLQVSAPAVAGGQRVEIYLSQSHEGDEIGRVSWQLSLKP